MPHSSWKHGLQRLDTATHCKTLRQLTTVEHSSLRHGAGFPQWTVGREIGGSEYACIRVWERDRLRVREGE